MPLTCKWKTTCSYCGDTIEEGDSIVLTSEKEKMCYSCAELYGYICDCGNDKKPEYDLCWNCRTEAHREEQRRNGNLCACGKWKRPQYPTCYACKQR
jgi:hypothetical protein